MANKSHHTWTRASLTVDTCKHCTLTKRARSDGREDYLAEGRWLLCYLQPPCPGHEYQWTHAELDARRLAYVARRRDKLTKKIDTLSK